MRNTLVLMLSLLCAQAPAAVTRCGGDGPNPLADVPSGANSALVPTRGLPLEFKVWENKHTLVYRSDSNQIHFTDLASGAERQPMPSLGALVPFYDPAERYLIANFGSWIFDAQTNSVWPSSGEAFTPLYASENAVLGADLAADGWHLQMALANQRVRLCQPLALPATWKLSTGQHDPYFDFYETKPTTDGVLLFTYRVDTSNCSITTWQYLNTLPGEVQAVYSFLTDGQTAAKIDNPKTDLLWTTQETGCRLFHVGKGIPLQPNPALPVLAIQPDGSGLALVDLMAEQSSYVLKDDRTIGTLGTGDVYLTGDQHQIFVRTVAEPMLLRITK